MNAAKRIIDIIGGQSAVATLLGKRQSTVQYWVKTGTIPSRYQAILIENAQEQGTELCQSDFYPVDLNNTVLRQNESIGFPVARYRGFLEIMEMKIPVYVLSDEQRVIGRTSATELLTNIKGGGHLEKYLSASPLRPFLDIEEVVQRMVSFNLPEVEGLGNDVKGLPHDLFLDVCRSLIRALEESSRPDYTEARLTDRQKEIAVRAGQFLGACAGVGLAALIDEATGYQYDRAKDALQFKLKLYLEDDMRKWEKTFPDELWQEFGRLTKWEGSLNSRPKYWGKLVMELIYEYLDPDVSDWLKNNVPKPKHGQNYHQWLSGQYGLKKLIQHIYMLIGMARACKTMMELRERMAFQYGRKPMQLTIFMPPFLNDARTD